MKIRKIFSTAVFASLLMPAILNSGAATASENKCLPEPGAYIITLESTSGFVARGVISFDEEDTLAVTSSNEGGSTNFAPFTSQLGTWKCVGNQITARTIDFTLPLNGQNKQIGRIDYKATVTGKNMIQGTLEGRFFPLNGNPQASDPAPAFTNTFRGELIKPRL
ncbi:hypothetical protein LC605_04535 [Nostoc sp. CHAB 5836]|uniref:hypothetical protein n=1 Tax=Nostoc sp. CHAB 5836 TaxID=2780404 RepID=UPI001E6323C7|nr:hypothetical protein [Nostoc sp. CHAB 5836]MCC5614356.1 hypothetical protein [Nostoc sp. CHAB 5836]